jgi:protein SCO1/2
MPRKQAAFPIVPAVLLAALLLAIAGVLIARSGNSSAPSAPSVGSANGGFEGAPLPAVAAPPLRLTDLSGRPVALSDYRGRVVVLTFLYPGCGATCTVIAQQIRGALDELPSPVPVVIVSADPAADSPAAVQRFLRSVSLSGRAVYLTGSAGTLAPIWRAYRVRPASAGAAVFGRYAFVMLLDRSGRERVLYETEQLTPESLAHDIRTLGGG